MMAMGLDEEKERLVDPTNDAELLNKYSWGSNNHGQLGMPYHNSKKSRDKVGYPFPKPSMSIVGLRRRKAATR